MNKNTKKNVILLVSSTLLSIILIYILFFFYIYLNLDRFINQRFNSINSLEFHKKYSQILHHIRDTSSHKKYFQNLKNGELNNLFTILSDYSSDKNNVLFQGDSWAEQFLVNEGDYKLTIEHIKKISAKNNIGFINAGISSYSPTLMKLQFDVLEKDFNIKPDIVVIYIDQTDIGDENCRYKHNRIFQEKKLIAIKEESFSGRPFDYTMKYKESEILLENNLKILKAFHMTNYKIFYGLKKMKVKNANKINRILNYGWKNRTLPKCYWPEIARYLFQSNEEELNYFRNSINFYLDSIEKKSYVQKIIVVTFPHLNHFQHLVNNNENIYKHNVSDIIDDLLADRIKTDHLNFSNLIIEKNIKINKENFKKDDPASHLEPNFYSTFFIKEITKRILKYIDK